MSPNIHRQSLCLFRRLGHVRLQPRNDILFERGDQTMRFQLLRHRVDFLVHIEERLSIHGIDPIIGGGPQTQSLARYIMTRQLGLISVIHAHMAVAVEIEIGGVLLGYPFLSQFRVPTHRQPHLLAQQLQLLAQSAHFNALSTLAPRDSVQPQ